jgi:hypothetical protein
VSVCLGTVSSVSGHSVGASNTPSHSVFFDARCSIFLTPLVRGHAVVQSVESLPYNPEGRGFDSRYHWHFSLTQSFRPHYDSAVDSASNINEYQGYLLGGKGGRCGGLTTLTLPGADRPEIWEPQSSGTQWACTGITLYPCGKIRRSGPCRTLFLISCMSLHVSNHPLKFRGHC